MAATKRGDAYVCKLAMTFAALEGTLPYIQLDQLEAAIAVGEYAARCAEYLVGLETSRATPEGDLTEYLLKWAREHSGVLLRRMQQCTWRQVHSAEKFNKILENLGKAERIEIKGSPRRVYYLD